MVDAELHYKHGICHQHRGEWRQAAKCYRQAIRLLPTWPEAIHNLGFVLRKQNQLPAAVRCYEKAVALEPDNPAFFNNLGNALRAMGKNDQAIFAFRNALKLSPEYTQALYNLSKAYSEQGRIDQAIAACRRAIRIEPSFYSAYHDLGMLHKRQGNLNDARTCLLRAIELDPGAIAARLNLGNVLIRLKRWEEAIDCLHGLIAIKPDSSEALYNLGNIYKKIADFDHAEKYLKRAIEIEPDFADAHFNLSLVLLALGKLKQGWAEYEWRLKKKHAFCFDRPLWQGESLNGKTLLVQDEQGLGDTFQFIRYLPILVDNHGGAKIIFQTRRKLFRLVESLRCCSEGRLDLSGKDSAPDNYDFTIPLLSVPKLIYQTQHKIPSDIPYLSVQSNLLKKWEKRLSRVTGLKIGICWQGSRENNADKFRSVSLELFYDMAAIPGLQLISLQKYDGIEQLSACPSHVNIINFSSELDCGADAFVDTAALMQNLDLIITIDSAVAHLAGALGIDTWLLLSKVPDWRWGIEGDDCPWYPTIRLFRQKEHGYWKTLLESIGNELRTLI
jgi:tetratricopeptide (TPR) repeat protein